MKVNFQAPAGAQRVLFALFAVSGFCGLIYESIWAYYLKLFVGHAAYAQTVVLVVFIGGMAIGAWAAGRMAARTPNPLLAYAIVEAIVGLFALAFQWIFSTTTDWAYASLLPALCSADGICAPQWALAGLLILPQSILLGTTFPLMSAGILRAFPQAPGRTLSMLYFTNSLGAVFGVLASTFVLIPAFGLPGTTRAAGLMNLALAAVVAAIAMGTENARRTHGAMATPAGAEPADGLRAATRIPARTLGAPHTMVSGASPASADTLTWHTLRRSASGCFSTDITSPTTTRSNAGAAASTPSISMPPKVRRSASCRVASGVSTKVRNQFSENFIAPRPA